MNCAKVLPVPYFRLNPESQLAVVFDFAHGFLNIWKLLLATATYEIRSGVAKSDRLFAAVTDARKHWCESDVVRNRIANKRKSRRDQGRRIAHDCIGNISAGH